jgi:hypothetical protein
VLALLVVVFLAFELQFQHVVEVTVACKIGFAPFRLNNTVSTDHLAMSGSQRKIPVYEDLKLRKEEERLRG